MIGRITATTLTVILAASSFKPAETPVAPIHIALEHSISGLEHTLGTPEPLLTDWPVVNHLQENGVYEIQSLPHGMRIISPDRQRAVDYINTDTDPEPEKVQLFYIVGSEFRRGHGYDVYTKPEPIEDMQHLRALFAKEHPF